MQNGGKRPGAGRPKGSRSPETHEREAARAQRLAEIGLTAQKVVDELAILGFANIADAFDVQGNLLPIHKMTREQAASIASFEVIKKNAEAGDGQTDVVHKIRVWDRVKTLEILAKYLGLLKDKVEHSGDVQFTWKKPPE
jgi:phage terminase small subunit